MLSRNTNDKKDLEIGFKPDDTKLDDIQNYSSMSDSRNCEEVPLKTYNAVVDDNDESNDQKIASDETKKLIEPEQTQIEIDTHDIIHIPLKTFNITVDEDEREEKDFFCTEFNDLQTESDEREKELIEEGQRQIMKNKTDYKKKISIVFSAIDKFKCATKTATQSTSKVKYQPKWTDLHHASARSLVDRVKELLDFEKDPNIVDDRGRTALDVAGIGFYQGIKINNLSEVLRILLAAGGRFNTMKGNIDSLDTVLHTAVQLDCQHSVKIILDEGVSVECLNSAGLTPLHICINNKSEEMLKILLTYPNNESTLVRERANTRDISGFTLLQSAVVSQWMPGVQILLDSGADVTAATNLPFDLYNNVEIEDGNVGMANLIYRLEQLHETPVHLAAATGNRHLLRKLLAKRKSAANYFNRLGQSPLYTAIRSGSISCVKTLLNMGADILRVTTEDQSAIHVAILCGFKNIVEFILEHADSDTHTLLNLFDKQGYAPIHTAVANNRIDCIELLGNKNAFLRLRTKGCFIADWTPIHIAAAKNYPDAVETILKFEEKAIEDVDHQGRSPLHLAASRCNREVMIVMLRNGAVLSNRTKRDENAKNTRKKGKTALRMISSELPNPKTFFEEAFDTFIESNDPELETESGNLITIDYGVFTTVDGASQIKVLEKLVRCDQQDLLLHPLVESLIHLKWRHLLPFFYVIVLIYGYIALSLYAVIIGNFYDENREDTFYSSSFLVPPFILVCLLEFLFISVHRTRYFYDLENWTKILCILFTFLLLTSGYKSWTESDFSRHLATGALLLSWAQIMFLLSRFPFMGIYVLMFCKVSINVLKILLTFSFLLLAFALCFKIQYHSTPPFDGLWTAFIKTIVMMTSEFEFKDLFDDEHSKVFTDSRAVVHIIFVLFLIFVSIVFVNFMLGVAVSDVNDLKTDGDIRQLEKRVQYLSTLDILAFSTFIEKILHHKFTSKRYIKRIKIKAGIKKHWVVLYEVKERNGVSYFFEKEATLPPRILDNIFQKIKTKKEQKEEDRKAALQRMQIDTIYKTIVGSDTTVSNDIIKGPRKYCSEANCKTKFDGAIDLINDLIKNDINNRNENFKQKLYNDKSTQTYPMNNIKDNNIIQPN